MHICPKCNPKVSAKDAAKWGFPCTDKKPKS